MENLEEQIRDIFNGSTLTNVVVDAEFGNVTATIDVASDS